MTVLEIACPQENDIPCKNHQVYTEEETRNDELMIQRRLHRQRPHIRLT